MSAYIVEETTITRILHGLRTLAGKGYGINREFERLGDETQIGRLLWDMNEAAVYARYPEDKATAGMGTAGVYVWRGGERCSLLSSFKAIGSLLYQCTEGDIPQSPLYGMLERLKEALADRIITTLPEYERAP